MIYNSDYFGFKFSRQLIDMVWEKGTVVSGFDSNLYRKDTCGAWIQKSEYGNTGSEYGWEIDHIIPKSNGGGDALSNLQPLQWENNRHKGDNYPNWSCLIGSRI